MKNRVLWTKGLLNGFFAWILGFVAYLIPGFIVAFKMGFELGPKSNDQAEVSEQINKSIQIMYQTNTLLVYGFIVVTALLIFWRACIITKKSQNNGVLTGLLVAVIPVVLNASFGYSMGFDVSDLIAFGMFTGAGYAGGFLNCFHTQN